LTAATVAAVPIAFPDGTGIVGFATWAYYAVWPAFGFEEVDRGLFGGELFKEFKGAEVAFVVTFDGVWVV
jgi:hypothetical protein